VLIVVHGEDDDLGVGNLSANQAGGFDPISGRHRNVEDNNVRREADRESDSFLTVSG
jgi:hypothetical protein